MYTDEMSHRQMCPFTRIFLAALCAVIISATATKATAAQVSSGSSLVVTAIIDPPFAAYKADFSGQKGNDRFEGFSIDLLKLLAQHANFTYDIHLVKDGRYGRVEATGWTGMIGELVNREADLAVGSITITENRTGVVDFTEPFLGSGLTILMKKPLPGHIPEAVTGDAFEQLASQTEVEYGAFMNGSTMAFFENSPVELHQKIWKYLSTNPVNLVKSTSAGPNRVRSSAGRYAFIVEKVVGVYEATRPPCDVMSVGELPAYKGYGIALQKISPWTERLSSLIKQWKSDGTIARLHTKWWNTENCST